MFGQMWRTSNLLFCILLHKAFANDHSPLEGSNETLATTIHDSITNQHTTDSVFNSESDQPTKTSVTSSMLKSLVVTSRKRKPKTTTHTVGVTTHRETPSYDDGELALLPLNGSVDSTTEGWLLDFKGPLRTLDMTRATSIGVLYSDKDVYDYGPKTGAIEEQRARDSFNSEVEDARNDILYFFGVLAGCIIITIGALSAKTQMNKQPPNPSHPDLGNQEEELEDSRDAEDTMEEFQLKSHWLSELGNKM